ncbi:MAG: hypothetical protein K0S61_1961 [Anaerocolumna sp.]|jgi:hypothetical protein|nr:hypothetical protein [Anaerocolumna sp.]
MSKKWGIGSFSFLLFILTILWSVNIKSLGDFCLGDFLLNAVDLPTWSNGLSGTHYTVYYSFIFLIPATIIGIKFKNHKFAKSGKIGSAALMCFLLIFSIFMVK